MGALRGFRGSSRSGHGLRLRSGPLRALGFRLLRLRPRLPLAVGAVEDARVALAVEDDELVAHIVEQRAVVGDEEQHAAVAALAADARLVDVAELVERLLEAFRARDVEVVGRLVEHEQVLGACDERCEHEPPALAAREVPDRLVLLFAREEERAREVARLLLARARRSLERADRVLQELPGQLLLVDVVLRLAEPSDREARRALDLARIRIEVAEERADERRLAGAVRADDADAVARARGEREVLEADALAEGLRDPLGDEREVAHLRRVGELEAHHAHLGVLLDERVLLEALEARLAAARLLRALARLVAVDERLLLADLVLLLLMLALDGEHALGAQRAEGRVVAGILAQHAAVDLDDARDDAVEEPAVVRDEDDRALELVGEEVLEPAASLDVKVIGRLVEKQEIGAREQEPREAEARLLATREALDREIEVFVREAESVERRVDLVVDRVSACGLDRLLDRDLAVHELLEFVGLRGRHALEDAVELLLELLDRGEGLGGRAAQSLVLRQTRVLLEIADAHGARDLDLAVVGLEEPRDQLEQRALAAAVAADEADALAFMDRTAHAVEKEAGAVAEAEVGERDERHADGCGATRKDAEKRAPRRPCAWFERGRKGSRISPSESAFRATPRSTRRAVCRGAGG